MISYQYFSYMINWLTNNQTKIGSPLFINEMSDMEYEPIINHIKQTKHDSKIKLTPTVAPSDDVYDMSEHYLRLSTRKS